MSDTTVLLQLKYNGQPIIINCLSREHNVSDLKEELFKLTRVLPKNQKILGLRTTNSLFVPAFNIPQLHRRSCCRLNNIIMSCFETRDQVNAYRIYPGGNRKFDLGL